MEAALIGKNTPNGLNLESLPEEIIIKMCSFLSAVDIATFCRCCKRFNSIIQGAEQLWKFLCQRDFPNDSSQVWYGWTNRNFYSKVLHPLRHFFGLWRRRLKHYGGLIKIQVNRDGVAAYECLPPFDTQFEQVEALSEKIQKIHCSQIYRERRRFRYKLIFNIKPVGHSLQCFCYQSMLGHLDRVGHSPEKDVSEEAKEQEQVSTEERNPANVTSFRCLRFLDKDTDAPEDNERRSFSWRCERVWQHDYSFDYWFEMEHGFRPITKELIPDIVESMYHDLDYYAKVNKFETLTNSSDSYQLLPVFVQSACGLDREKCIIKPGLYFGSYSYHGWEIIDVRYNADCTRIEGRKITGDVNVPAGEISFQIFLDKSLYFTEADQENTGTILEALKRNNEANYMEHKRSLNMASWQHFRLPSDCIDEISESTETCVGRSLAQGQVAFSDFTDPSFVEAVFAAFNADSFAMLWLDLSSLSRYYRVIGIEDRITV